MSTKAIDPDERNLSYFEIAKRSFVRGIAWAFGVTVGFVLVSTIFVFVFRQIGGLPVVGGWVAEIVQSTQEQLQKRTPVFRNVN